MTIIQKKKMSRDYWDIVVEIDGKVERFKNPVKLSDYIVYPVASIRQKILDFKRGEDVVFKTKYGTAKIVSAECRGEFLETYNNFKTNELCIHCLKATRKGCNWAASFQPVEGWVAEVWEDSKGTHTWIKDCPEYIPNGSLKR